MRYITKSEVIAMARKVVAGREDFVYNPDLDRADCLYVEGVTLGEDGWDVSNARPSCLWGHVFLGEGIVTPEWFMREGVNSTRIGAMVEEIDYVEFSEGAVEFMRASQAEQDTGRSWGEAIERSIEGSIEN